jgi:hypothetical protein
MKQYLVTYLGEMDDIPCGLFVNRDEADALARDIGATMDAEGDDHHPAVADALVCMSRDVGTYCGVAVVTFEGPVVVAWDLVVDGDEGDGTAD